MRRKNYKYKSMPKPSKKDNRKNVIRLRGTDKREDSGLCTYSWFGKRQRNFCKDCNHSQDKMNFSCSNCGSKNIVTLSSDTRVPSKKRSKKVWKNFIKNFVNKR